jgi:hypothetical protein
LNRKVNITKTMDLDLSKYTEGIYYLKVTTNKNKYLNKLILLR